MTLFSRSRTSCLLALLLALAFSGCSERGDKRSKIQRVEGVAKSIDLETKQVSMIVKSDKGDEHVLTGTFRSDTTVMINGRSQTIADINPGDQVVVYGYRDGKGESKKLVATKVEVVRPNESDWKSTGTPQTDEPDRMTQAGPVPTTQPATVDPEENRGQITTGSVPKSVCKCRTR